MSLLIKKYVKHKIPYSMLKIDQMKEMLDENIKNPEIIVEYYSLREELEDDYRLAIEYGANRLADTLDEVLSILSKFDNLDDIINLGKYLNEAKLIFTNYNWKEGL